MTPFPRRFTFASAAFFLVASVASAQFGPVKLTTSGYVMGFVGEDEPDLHTYLGIPYAEPPLGEL